MEKTEADPANAEPGIFFGFISVKCIVKNARLKGRLSASFKASFRSGREDELK